MVKTTLAACLVAAALAAPAYAQNASTQAERGAAAQSQSVRFLQAKTDTMRLDDLDDLDVYNDRNEKIGEIDDVILDRSGRIEAVVISVGGFLGIGERHVGVPFDALRFERDRNQTSAANRTTTTNTNTAAGTPPRGADRTQNMGDTAENAARTTNAPRDARAPAANEPATTGATRSRDADDDAMKPQRAILAGVTKETLEKAPPYNPSRR